MSYPHNAFFPSNSFYADQDRKRQRRLTAGAFASVVFGGTVPPPPTNNNNSRKPVALVPFRAVSGIRRITKNDILSGRGGRINSHVGNIQFRDIVLKRKNDYRAPSTKKLEKAHIAAEIVYFIRSMDPPGRFLKEDPDGSWYDIGDEKAIKKVGQALREDALLAKPKAVEGGPREGKEFNEKEDTTEQNDKLRLKLKAEEAPEMAVSPSHDQPLRIVTVSSRGAKRVSSTTRSVEAAKTASSVPFQPLMYAEKSESSNFSFDAPVKKEVEKGRSNSSSSLKSSIFGMFRGERSRAIQANGVSLAAAAAMNDAAEEAFGRPFHPAENALRPAEPSLVSGMSSLSDWSHPGTSVTAASASFLSPRRSNNREKQYTSQSNTEQRTPQHQWNDKTFICFSPRLPNQDCSEGESQTFIVPGTPDSVQEALFTSCFHESTLDARKRTRSYGSGRSAGRSSDFCDESFLPTENDSVDSLTSLPGSILSDLSESLMALDLGDPRSKDILDLNSYR